MTTVESIDNYNFYVHFTDHLGHKGIEHTYRCKQKVMVNSEGMITHIYHLEDKEQRNSLNKFYKKVGLK